MFAFLLAVSLAAAPSPDPCAYDRDRLLALDQNAFDQDQKGGWRTLDEKGCHTAAADLIRDYRLAHNPASQILLWHEGQIRGFAGQTKDAIALFDKARAKEPDHLGWNLYVDGTIAFLKHDRAALIAARNKLAVLPRPAEWPAQMGWPQNLDVLDRLLACFDGTYHQAYGGKCPT
jgi:hypothetical protein